MKILRSDSPPIADGEIAEGELIVVTTREELAVLAGAINEALDAVEGWEFHIRLGVTPENARDLLSRISEILRESSIPD